MYIFKKDSYICDFCGVELAWSETDEEHGDIWGCEVCHKDFCVKCFIDRHGTENFNKMLWGPRVKCPDCFKEENADENASGDDLL